MEGGGGVNGVKSHPKRTEMKKGKKKIPAGAEASKQALGNGTLRRCSQQILLGGFFLFGFSEATERR